MSVSRRTFLTATTVMHVSGLYSSSAFSCEGGVLRYCPTPLPPHDFLSETCDENGVEVFLNDKYGLDAWSYSASPISLRMPEIAENPNVIPLEIRTDGSTLAGRYRTLVIYTQQPVKVWDTEKYPTPDHVPERYMISQVAKFTLGEQLIPNISIRLRGEGATEFRIIAVFVPVDSSQKVEVVKQERPTRIMHCFYDRPVYIDRKWPKGLTMECMSPTGPPTYQLSGRLNGCAVGVPSTLRAPAPVTSDVRSLYE